MKNSANKSTRKKEKTNSQHTNQQYLALASELALNFYVRTYIHRIKQMSLLFGAKTNETLKIS